MTVGRLHNGFDRHVHHGLSRRSFLELAGAASLGALALSGCAAAPSNESASGSATASETSVDNVSPIPPLPEPASWDNEVDVVVAGSDATAVMGA